MKSSRASLQVERVVNDHVGPMEGSQMHALRRFAQTSPGFALCDTRGPAQIDRGDFAFRRDAQPKYQFALGRLVTRGEHQAATHLREHSVEALFDLGAAQLLLTT